MWHGSCVWCHGVPEHRGSACPVLKRASPAREQMAKGARRRGLRTRLTSAFAEPIIPSHSLSEVSPWHRPERHASFLQTSAPPSPASGCPGRTLPRPGSKLKKPIKIGCQSILSGPLGGYGGSCARVPTWRGEINAQGGIGGSPIELNFATRVEGRGREETRATFVEDWGPNF